MGEGAARAWIGLGSNLGDTAGNLAEAVRRIEALPNVDLLARSSLYRSKPWGFSDQPDFLNAVIAVRTGSSAAALLRSLLKIEWAMGRRRDGPRWGPRLIDLDLLLFGGEVLRSQQLELPHPRLHERRFVLEPLAELAPGLEIPGRGTVADLLAESKETAPERLVADRWPVASNPRGVDP